MPIAISDDHRALSSVVRSFLEDHRALEVAKGLLDAHEEGLPPFWDELTALGWLGLHVPEAYGGSGYGLEELAVVVEELGRAAAPGPFLPTVWASAVLAAGGDEDQRSSLLEALTDGSVLSAAGFGGQVSVADGRAEGLVPVVIGGGTAAVLVLEVGGDVAVIDVTGCEPVARPSLDSSRPIASFDLQGAPVRVILPGAAGNWRSIGRTLAAAEAAGGAAACVEMATEYVKVRKQFGRVIGTFQAVKHHAANMAVAGELATAAAWDAARAQPFGRQFDLAAAVAAAQAIPAFVTCAQTNIQLHGGIGYTWEHPAHLFLRRAGALAALFGPLGAAQGDVTTHAVNGVRREVTVNLPPEADVIRREVASFVERITSLPEEQRLTPLLDEGYVNPHWPRPWGRAAGAVEQLVIDEEFGRAGVTTPEYGIGGWIIQTLTQHADEDQISRWIRPSLEGRFRWCQLFSEPDAGSDAAGIRTRGTRVEGGWIVTGQKIWTSGAQFCNRGWATVRTDPEAAKHAGITMMVIDLDSAQVEIRPLREASGGEAFNEVFINDYFVPDEDVVGRVNDGWRVARSTLGNERVSIGRGMATTGPGIDLVETARAHSGDTAVWEEIGGLLAENQAISLLNLRSTERAVAGAEPGPEGNVAKLLNGEHAQKVVDFGLRVTGPEGTVIDSPAAVGTALIFVRCLTIAGGTSEIVRSQIGERVLGLPRDPLIS